MIRDYAAAQQASASSMLEMVTASDTLQTIDLHRHLTKKSGSAELLGDNSLVVRTPQMESVGLSIPLDIHTWLPFAAPHYRISPKLEDYVLTPVIVMPADLPNRNRVAFPLSQLIEFQPDVGMQAYKTWKGQPTFREHRNDDITQSYGVIADSFLRKMKGFGGGKVWKVLLLLAFDRNKNPDTVSRILSGEYNSYSMGAYVNSYTCSYCNMVVGNGCPHLSLKDNRMYVLNGKLVFKNVIGVRGFECSVVATPAFTSALSDTLIVMR